MSKKYIYTCIGILAVICAVIFISISGVNKINRLASPSSNSKNVNSEVSQKVGNEAGNKASEELSSEMSNPHKIAGVPDKITKLSIDSSAYDVLLADTFLLRQKGLSGRTTLGSHEVMLFVFQEEGKNFFWMKDMLFSIDMVWLDSDRRVMHIESNVSPDTYPQSFGPQADSRYVLEFKEGTAAREGLKIGDKINFI